MFENRCFVKKWLLKTYNECELAQVLASCCFCALLQVKVLDLDVLIHCSFIFSYRLTSIYFIVVQWYVKHLS